MSWPAFSWNELQTRTPRIPERLLPSTARAAEVLSLLAMFLTPFAAMEAALGIWRLGDDFGWAGPFFINRGLLSHWQVWFALALFTQATSVYLNGLLGRQESTEKRK